MDQEIRVRLDQLIRRQAELRKNLEQLDKECSKIKNALPPHPGPSSAKVEKLTETTELERHRLKQTTPSVTPPPLPPQTAQPSPGKPTHLIAKDTPTTTTPPEKKAHRTFNTGEWEITFGRIWLVRIGVILLLTGLIFLSTYAYKNWLFNAGPAIKVTFFMTVSLTLTGIGLWLENRRKRFRQYGRVVASGGLAAGYYTIYAAHFVPALHVIHSPILAGTLITLWAAIILAYAVWKQSRVVAVMAIGLAFYGTVVNPSGWLSLFSALLLSSAGIWLMLRFKWIAIGMTTMISAYAAHAFWLGLHPGTHHQEIPSLLRFTYLACYWLLFTIALTVPLVRSGRVMSTQLQRTFCTINNGAAWALTTFLIPQFTPHSEIGWISIGVGGLFLLLSLAARNGKIWHHSLALISGYQGALIASLGILIEATGYTRFLIMAVEACILMAGARYFGGALARVFSAAAFFCAIVTALPEMNHGTLAPWQSYAALALVCAAYTAIVHRDGSNGSDIGDDATGGLVPMLPAAITWLVAGIGVFGQWQTNDGIIGLWVSATTVMAGHYLIRKTLQIRWKTATCHLALFSPLVALVGSYWYLDEIHHFNIYQAAIPFLGATIFWQMSPRLTNTWDEINHNTKKPSGRALEWIFSLLLWIIIGSTIDHHLEINNIEPSWLFIGGLLAIGGTVASELTHRTSIGIPAISFHAVALVALLTHGNDESILGWAPTGLLLAHLAICDLQGKTLNPTRIRSMLALGLVAATSIHAFQEYGRPDLILTTLGLALFAWAWMRQDHVFAFAGGVIPLIIACIATTTIHEVQDWGRYIPIISIFILHALLWQKTREKPHWKTLRIILFIVGLSTLFFSSSVHVLDKFDGSGLAICWAMLATLLFCAGLILRCRPYRLIGLYWLAAAVLHVLFIDVMKLETLGRILSFIILGILLLALGFLYNRFQETIRKFL